MQKWVWHYIFYSFRGVANVGVALVCLLFIHFVCLGLIEHRCGGFALDVFILSLPLDVGHGAIVGRYGTRQSARVGSTREQE